VGPTLQPTRPAARPPRSPPAHPRDPCLPDPAAGQLLSSAKPAGGAPASKALDLLNEDDFEAYGSAESSTWGGRGGGKGQRQQAPQQAQPRGQQQGSMQGAGGARGPGAMAPAAAPAAQMYGHGAMGAFNPQQAAAAAAQLAALNAAGPGPGGRKAGEGLPLQVGGRGGATSWLLAACLLVWAAARLAMVRHQQLA
jgi:hypothetical protein